MTLKFNNVLPPSNLKATPTRQKPPFSTSKVKEMISIGSLGIITPFINQQITKTLSSISPFLKETSKRVPQRAKIPLLVSAVLIEETRINRVIQSNEKNLDKKIENTLKNNIPKDYVLFGIHGSRQKLPFKNDKRTHTYFVPISEQVPKIVEAASYCLFYTQGVGDLFLLCAHKDSVEKIKQNEIHTAVEKYINPESFRKDNNNNDRIIFVPIPLEHCIQSPWNLFRNFYQLAVTQSLEAYYDKNGIIFL